MAEQGRGPEEQYSPDGRWRWQDGAWWPVVAKPPVHQYEPEPWQPQATPLDAPAPAPAPMPSAVPLSITPSLPGGPRLRRRPAVLAGAALALVGGAVALAVHLRAAAPEQIATAAPVASVEDEVDGEVAAEGAECDVLCDDGFVQASFGCGIKSASRELDSPAPPPRGTRTGARVHTHSTEDGRTFTWAEAEDPSRGEWIVRCDDGDLWQVGRDSDPTPLRGAPAAAAPPAPADPDPVPPPALDVSEDDDSDFAATECFVVTDELRLHATSRPVDGVDVELAGTFGLQGERGMVFGGYLSGTSPTGIVDGQFATWYLRDSDGALFRYTDAALQYSAWPSIGDGAPTPLSTRVEACAQANAG